MIRLRLMPDFREEGWPSMDLVTEMLVLMLQREHSAEVALSVSRPQFTVSFGRILPPSLSSLAFKADRFLNRFVYYPLHERSSGTTSDAFHICDHSYAHLALGLRLGSTGVYCHDIDVFRCLVEPDRDPRPGWFRMLARRVLRGLQAAAVVFHSTNAVRDDLLRFGLVDPARLVLAPYGFSFEFTPEPPEQQPRLVDGPYVLHVGSMIARKRIDLVLYSFAGVAAAFPDMKLVQVGPKWHPEQEDSILRLGIGNRVVKLTGVDRPHLAELYRGAEVVLLPSDAEGFGLPIIEALACGTAVLASDLPVLREVGGDAVTYLPPGDAAAWAQGLNLALAAPEQLPRRNARLERAARYSWSKHTATIVETYRRLLSGVSK